MVSIQKKITSWFLAWLETLKELWLLNKITVLNLPERLLFPH